VDPEPATPPRGSRIDRVTDLVVGILLLVGAVWAAVNAGAATWDAAVMLVRGESVPATVVAADHDDRLGRLDDLILALPAPYDVRAEVATPREDLGPGDVVPTVVDPEAPVRAALVDDGWPWRTTLPLLLVPLLALAGLFALGLAAFGRSPDTTGPGTTEPPDDPTVPAIASSPRRRKGRDAPRPGPAVAGSGRRATGGGLRPARPRARCARCARCDRRRAPTRSPDPRRRASGHRWRRAARAPDA